VSPDPEHNVTHDPTMCLSTVSQPGPPPKLGFAADSGGPDVAGLRAEVAQVLESVGQRA
jgi:hypothetical protein